MNQIAAQTKFSTGQELLIIFGDLTEETTDAIVNAANAHLSHGGGVAGAILRRGGIEIQRESEAWVRQYGLVTHDHPAYTKAGNLPCKYIIHAVGPIWGSGDEDKKLASAIHGSLTLANQLKLTSIAIPPIATGIFGYPKELASTVIFQSIQHYCLSNPFSSLKIVHLTILDAPTLSIFLPAFNRLYS